ncbi:hypothetical protein BDQ12DRAFT_145465 [Crucibulum laeve]|uniref:Uncharacterized protein n=1 Tax=Crucibulum laeve TaxID=68775 RepID=A0A5C3LX90_9AGAR|nr:hypothetical protein BDQ12DRAFT_145465 [Crucibulum laeve]
MTTQILPILSDALHFVTPIPSCVFFAIMYTLRMYKSEDADAAQIVYLFPIQTTRCTSYSKVRTSDFKGPYAPSSHGLLVRAMYSYSDGRCRFSTSFCHSRMDFSFSRVKSIAGL